MTRSCRIVGLTRVRDESLILSETLEHFATYCDGGIIVLDDDSRDDTVNIARKHPAVLEVIQNPSWRVGRTDEEWRLRQILLDRGRHEEPEWFLYFDADERIEFDGRLPADCDGIEMRLFDAYITAEDADAVGTQRNWFGPEYRDIVMLFRNLPQMSYHLPDQRVVAGVKKPMRSGYVKHYGKAISIAEWEVTCDYYIENFPEPYRSKWSARKGCAIHTESDFARPLMSWEDAKSKGVMLHYAGSPVELPQEFANAMRAVAPQHYVCKRCGTVLRFFQVPFGRVAMVCPRGCR